MTTFLLQLSIELLDLPLLSVYPLVLHFDGLSLLLDEVTEFLHLLALVLQGLLHDGNTFVSLLLLLLHLDFMSLIEL